MRKRLFLLVLGISLPAVAGSAFSAGCTPDVETTPGTGGAGGIGGGFGGGFGGFTTTQGGFDAGADVLPDYIDPGCPDAGPPMTMFACDPYSQNNGDCMPGEGCYIFVQYPSEPCGQEVYGANCSPQGMGKQGSPCGGAQDCGGGFVCVVSGEGDQCVVLCNLEGESGCPSGLVCEPIDVEGFGGCL